MSEQLVTINVQLDDSNEAISLFGVQDSNLKRIEEEMQVSIISRGETVVVSGSTENVQLVEEMLKKLLNIIRKNISISERDVVYAIQLAKKNSLEFLKMYMKKRLVKRKR